jgi:hypothetical protein
MVFLKIMKHCLLFVLLGFSLLVKAQSDKIVFDYDAAGNQVKRYLCVNCPSTTGKNTKPKEVIALKEEDLQKFFPEDVISYYPNPVKEELFLKWELANENLVSSLQVYNLNGQTLQSYANLEKINTQTIPFQLYPSGTYIIILFYRNGEQKSIKIIKQ